MSSNEISYRHLSLATSSSGCASKAICKSAQDRYSIVGLECIRIALELIQKEQWLEIPPYKWKGKNTQFIISRLDTWKSALKAKLLSKQLIIKEFFLHETILKEETLNCLLQIGIDHVKKLINLDPDKTIPILQKKESLNISKFIRDHIEQNPLLKSLDFVEELYLFCYFSTNNISRTPHCLNFQLRYLKGLCTHLSPEISYPNEIDLGLHPLDIDPSDLLLLFLLQMCQLDSLLFQEKAIHQILSACMNTDIYKKIDKNQDEPETSSKIDDNVSENLKKFLNLLDRFGSLFKYNLKSTFFNHVILFKNDVRSPELKMISRFLYRGSGNLIFGMFFPLESTLIQNSSFKKLNSLPFLTAHDEAILEIEKLLPHEASHEERKTAAQALYKWWWYGECRSRKPVPLADREIDWLMHDLLSKDPELSSKKAVDLVEIKFRNHLPLIPFNRVRAEHYFSIFKFAQQKSA